ncbi:MAG: hypothetical protein Q9159_001435 [Coniocarpon cinnabarinum]
MDLTNAPSSHSTRSSRVEGYMKSPNAPDAPPIYPRIPLQTTNGSIAIDPAKSALVIIDMQNFFLSEYIGRPSESKGLKAARQLAEHAIPACRKADIQIVWLNWGLSQDEVEDMPPATLRAFGFSTVPENQRLTDDAGRQTAVDDHGVNTGSPKIAEKFGTHIKTPFGKDPRIYRGLGSMIEPVRLDDGSSVSGGQLLMRDQWNTELHPVLERARRDGMRSDSQREDVWIHKNRMSGLWGGDTLCTDYLKEHDFRTLIFAGVNTDQCVAGSLQDAFTKGYDCLLLSDGSATTSPEFAQQCVEYNTAKTWGFLLSCKDLEDGVAALQTAAPS